jgi:ribosomal protein L37AE/L43A
MSDMLIAVFGCSGMLIVGALVVGYVITGNLRKKSVCPNCGKKSLPKKAFVRDPAGGQITPAERDFAYALVTGIGAALIGAAISGFFIALVATSLGDESCSVKGLSLVCVSYGGGMKVTTTINLLIAFLFTIGGFGILVNGVQKIRRAVATKGKPMTTEFVCPKCKHSWTEEFLPAPSGATPSN